jgi:thioredoxin-related protein
VISLHRLLFRKFHLLILIFFCLQPVAHAQPAFIVLKTNGAKINTASIPKTKPLLLIYFSPDCDHCTKLMDELMPKMKDLTKLNILLVTFRPIDEIIPFEKKYGTASFRNITVGIEQPIFFIRNLYQLQSTPFTALYNRKGNLVISYKEETPVKDLIARVHSLQ